MAAEKAAMDFLLTSLVQFAESHLELHRKSGSEAKELKSHLKALESFVKNASMKKIKDESERMLVRQICDAIYEAEELVDAFVTRESSAKTKKWLPKFYSNYVTLDTIAQRVRQLKTDMESFHTKIGKAEKNNDRVNEMQVNEVSPVREENIVGLDDDADKIIGYLKEETKRIDIISIVGMPGVGKSTLAGKIFRDERIELEFPSPQRMWITVSKFAPKHVFLSIMRQLKLENKEMNSMSEHDLGAQVKCNLENRKFLIVMDDVWTSEDWSKIYVALPANNHLLKILITSSDAELSTNRRHNVQPLSLDRSEELLQFEAFGKRRWEPGSEDYGQKIAKACKGLPLLIVVAGDIMKKKLRLAGNDCMARAHQWEKLSNRVVEGLHDDPEGRIGKVISSSYDRLPSSLRSCFLYLMMFPRDIEIPAWSLFQMWIAEGFILKEKGDTLEDTAENYLEELIKRNLVTVDRRSSDGKVKTCHIHDPLRDFWMKQAGIEYENFLEEIRKSQEGDLEPEVTDGMNHRRLYIHSNIISQFVASKPSGCRVRSFVCFSKEIETLKGKHASTIPGAFKLLRVLDVKSAIFTKVPTGMYELLYLRYIHLSFNSKVLPRDFSNLWNIQTLIVESSERTLEIKADIWKMRHLRHVKTNAITTLPKPTKAIQSSVQTLGTISPENCTQRILEAACNLRRLSIRGKLEVLLSSSRRTEVSFDYMGKLSKLEKLKLVNDVSLYSSRDNPPSEGKMLHLPSSNVFPPNLKILTLSDTYLDWSQMKVLSSLHNLKVLKLKEKAFTGKYWEVAGGEFNNLRVLFIGRTDLVDWKMSAGNFSNLIHLELQNCEELKVVPIEFAKNPSLSVLILEHCRAAAPSAKEIERQKNMEADKTMHFNVTISPPIN